jgi:glycosyltransferase involved in cell wall biosynthesis
MKIAFLNAYQGMVDRGAETFVSEVAARLQKRNKVAVISGNMIPKQRWPILWRFFVDPSGISIFLFTLKNLPKIWKEKFNVVIPLNGGWQPALVRLVTWLYGGKMIISGQSGKGWDDRNNLWCFPDAFVALSTFLNRWAKKVNSFVKISYIPNGVDTKRFTPQGQVLQMELAKPIILCVGALTEEKRIDLVIRAVAKMGEASLLVVGDGILHDDLKNLGQKMLGKRFQLIKVPYSEMPKVYRVANIFTLASPWYRSFEIVLVEAMAMNMLVVANDDPIRREIVGDAGLFVDPTDTEAYAQKLKEALNADWGEKPRNQAEKFSWDKIAVQYEELFKKLLNEE